MTRFVLWLVLALVAFGGSAGGYHVYLTEHPRRVAVVVDTSYPMQSVWGRVPRILDELDEARYTEYALASDKRLIRSWSPTLHLALGQPYGPRDFSRLADPAAIPELAAADQVVFITNAPAAETETLPNWRILRLGS
jgi:hypothetical protein